jgi:AcrR family transcriptional regulator
VVTTTFPSLRERTRRAVQAELVDVAKRLFVEQGYEQTTVDAIAAAAGMSKRSFFRYFGSKEDLILGKYDLMGEQLLARLAERPDAEPLWTSLRRMFDDVVGYTTDRANAAATDELERIVSTTPVLHAAYLQRLHRIQSDIADVVRQRALRAGHPFHADDPSPSAIVGAAFAAVAAARAVSVAHGRPFDAAVDAAMRAVGGAATR